MPNGCLKRKKTGVLESPWKVALWASYWFFRPLGLQDWKESRGKVRRSTCRSKRKQGDWRVLGSREECRGRSLTRSGCKRKGHLKRQKVGRRIRHSATLSSSISSASSGVRDDDVVSKCLLHGAASRGASAADGVGEP